MKHAVQNNRPLVRLKRWTALCANAAFVACMLLGASLLAWGSAHGGCSGPELVVLRFPLLVTLAMETVLLAKDAIS